MKRVQWIVMRNIDEFEHQIRKLNKKERKLAENALETGFDIGLQEVYRFLKEKGHLQLALETRRLGEEEVH